MALVVYLWSFIPRDWALDDFFNALRTACDPDDTENIPASIPPITSPSEKRLGAMTALQGNHQLATPVTPKDELGSITLEQAGDGFETPPKEKLEQNVIWSSYLVNPSRGKAKCRHCLTIFSLDTRRKMGLTSSMKNHLLSHGFGFGRCGYFPNLYRTRKTTSTHIASMNNLFWSLRGLSIQEYAKYQLLKQLKCSLELKCNPLNALHCT